MKKSDSIIEEILRILERHFAGTAGLFIPGATPVTTGMALYDHRETGAVLVSLLDGWLGIAEKGACFEESFARFIGVDHCIMVNSGSSANLAAIDALKHTAKSGAGTSLPRRRLFLQPLIL